MLERIRTAVNGYLMREFEEDCYKSVEDMPRLLPLAYTTAENEEDEIQISYNLDTCELLDMYNGEIVNRYYMDYTCFIDFMKYVSFDDLVRDLLCDSYE